jgi:hypothetical protein
MDVFSDQKLKKKSMKSINPILGFMTSKSIFSKDKDNDDDFKPKSQKKALRKETWKMHLFQTRIKSRRNILKESSNKRNIKLKIIATQCNKFNNNQISLIAPTSLKAKLPLEK